MGAAVVIATSPSRVPQGGPTTCCALPTRRRPVPLIPLRLEAADVDLISYES